MSQERDENGRFKKGVSGNPAGRAPRERELEYKEVLVSSVSLQDWKEIISKAVVDAKRGDPTARKFLADYLIGPPVQRQEVTGKDGGPVEQKVQIIEVVKDYGDAK